TRAHTILYPYITIARIGLIHPFHAFPVLNLRGRDHKLLLISFDGFRWDYDQDVETPNMDNLVKEGVRAKYITPPFVTMTSPSHFTTISGKSCYQEQPVLYGCNFS
uniref:Uncharacterized protein n=1 Tax=Varanus komodoensis TaxID=61221 RepID=A0A8D2LPD8_VARKO